MGVAQLNKIESFIAAKRRLAASYSALLADVPGLQLPAEMPWANNVYWMYGVVIHDEFGVSRDELMRELFKRGIDTRTFFCPMNIQPCFADIAGWRHIDCPIAERLWHNGLYLPSSCNLSTEQIRYICSAIQDISQKTL